MIKILSRALVGLLFTVSLAANSATVVTDTEFDDADWSGGIVTTGVGAAAGTFIGRQQIASPGDEGVNQAGNPGAFQYFAQVHGGRQNGTMTVRGFHFYDAFTYDPSLGALQSLNLSFDALVFESLHGGSPSDQLTMGAAIRQDDSFYFAPGIALTTFETWTLMQFDGLTESDFTYSGKVNPAPLPDFSLSGAPIEFGYYAYHASNFTTRGNGGVDNFVLEVNPQVSAVPIPPAIALFATGMLCLGFAGRNRRQSGIGPDN